jgi:hypothetical protein
MRTLICGSLAFDSIMVFQDHFKHHILPDKIHMLNVSFLVPEMRREFGGCAGNIAYNLKLLGGEPLIMATVGDDFGTTPTVSTTWQSRATTSATLPAPTPRRPSSPPISPTTRSPPSTPAR